MSQLIAERFDSLPWCTQARLKRATTFAVAGKLTHFFQTLTITGLFGHLF